jgi:hypothetical protein
MSFYTPKLKVIEAVQFIYGSEENLKEIKHFLGDAFVEIRMERHFNSIAELVFKSTPNVERVNIAQNSNYIVRGSLGDSIFYPMTESQFIDKYEPFGESIIKGLTNY